MKRWAGDHITTLVTAATEYPVSLADMKEHLRVDGTDEDGLISAYIAAAVSSIGPNGELGLSLCSETWDEAFQWPSKDVYLEVLPVQSLVSVTYYDTNNAQQTATLSDFALYRSGDWAFVRSDNWPQTFDRPDAITIRYVAGYGGAADVPLEIGHAIKMIVAHWYQNREDVSDVKATEMPRAAAHLLGLRRIGYYG